jgi:hypothetical protein
MGSRSRSCAARPCVGRHPVQTNRGQRESDDAEQPGEAGHGARLIERAIHLLLERSDARHRQVGIDFGERPLQLRFERAQRLFGDEQEASNLVRLKLESLHHRVRVVHRLRERHEEHRPGRSVEPEPGELRITHDAHDPERIDVLRQVRPKRRSSGSSSLLKNRRTNASFTTATSSDVSLSAALK